MIGDLESLGGNVGRKSGRSVESVRIPMLGVGLVHLGNGLHLDWSSAFEFSIASGVQGLT